LASNFLYRAWFDYRRKKNASEWLKKRKEQLPIPPYIKENSLRYYTAKYAPRILIETGTCWGEMVLALQKTFLKIYSIELSPQLYEFCRCRFSRLKHITIINGDSGRLLPKILADINERCIFWLDAHYSGGPTARGDCDTPIVKELETIASHCIKNHVVLIDDANEFGGKGQYPSIDFVKQFVSKRMPAAVEVSDNIIKIIPVS